MSMTNPIIQDIFGHSKPGFLPVEVEFDRLTGGVIMSFESEIMVPGIFLRTLTIARNTRRQIGQKISQFISLGYYLVTSPKHHHKTAVSDNPVPFFNSWGNMHAKNAKTNSRSYYLRGFHKKNLPRFRNQRMKSGKNWGENVEQISRLLLMLSIRNISGTQLEIDEGFKRWRDMTIKLRSQAGTVYLIGNGASASMASHFAADLSKNARVHTQVFSDLSLITAIANDLGYENVYAEPLKCRMKKNDLLVAISSSGNSPNIIRAIDQARQQQGKVVTLSAMDEDNTLRGLGDLNFYVPAQTYGPAESCHATILHYWMDLVTENEGNDCRDIAR